MQIHYNKYIAKFICFFGPLAFGVYLFHMNGFIVNKVINHTFDNISTSISLNSLFGYILLKSLKIFIVSLIIDYCRHLLFPLLRIRKILIFLEIKLRRIIN